MQTLVCEEIVDDRVENPMASEVQQGAVVVYHSFVVATKRTTVTIFQEDLRHTRSTEQHDAEPTKNQRQRPPCSSCTSASNEGVTEYDT